jgi:hypothetical protein
LDCLIRYGNPFFADYHLHTGHSSAVMGGPAITLVAAAFPGTIRSRCVDIMGFDQAGQLAVIARDTRAHFNGHVVIFEAA